MPATAAHKSRVASTRLNDVEAARELLSARYKPHGLRKLCDTTPFGLVHVSTPVPVGTFNVLTYGAEVEVTPEPFQDFFMLEMPLQGGARLESAGRKSAKSGPDKALFVPPHARFQAVWEAGTVQVMLQIRKDVVLERWQLMCGDATRQLPKVFPEIELETAEGWRVRQLLMLISEELKAAVSSDTNAMSETPLAAAAVDATLAYFRKHQTTMVDDKAAVLPASLRGCVRYIHANLARDLSVPVLVRHTRVSERTLFKLFRTFLHNTPRAYVEAERLKCARARLLEGVRVAEAAKSSGFTHQGRFAAAYERAYGEKPSETLQSGCPVSALASGS